MSDAADRAHLRRAVALAADCLTKPTDGPFGAVVVGPDGRVIAEGQNRVTQDNDPTAHAEVVAIRNACAALGVFHLPAGTALYSSCEPCPMCLGAAYWAHVGRIVFASDRDDAAKAGFDDAFLYDEMPKHPAERSVPMVRIAMSEADAVFRAWIDKPDKITY